MEPHPAGRERSGLCRRDILVAGPACPVRRKLEQVVAKTVCQALPSGGFGLEPPRGEFLPQLTSGQRAETRLPPGLGHCRLLLLHRTPLPSPPHTAFESFLWVHSLPLTLH